MADEHNLIRVVSDGTPESTFFYTSDGRQIEGVSSFFISGEPGGLVKLSLVLWPSKLDAHGYIYEALFKCPGCASSIEHKCKK